jgi:ribosomal protein L37AE/L43A
MEAPEKQKGKKKGELLREKFCPRCGSTDIFFARGLPQLWSIWECRNCGYYGAFIVEDGIMSQKIREEWARKHSVHSRSQASN